MTPQAQRVGLRLTRKRKDFLIRRLGGTCRGCGTTNGLEIDHIIESANGGPNELQNLQVLCKNCHKIKTKYYLKQKRPNAKGKTGLKERLQPSTTIIVSNKKQHKILREWK